MAVNNYLKIGHDPDARGEEGARRWRGTFVFFNDADPEATRLAVREARQRQSGRDCIVAWLPVSGVERHVITHEALRDAEVWRRKARQEG